MDLSPREMDIDIVPSVSDIDAPEWLWYKVHYSKIAVDDKTQSWKLAGPCTELVRQHSSVPAVEAHRSLQPSFSLSRREPEYHLEAG
jgi:hypothetical protein